MKREHVVWFLIGFVAAYGLYRFQGAIVGPPWRPAAVGRGG